MKKHFSIFFIILIVITIAVLPLPTKAASASACGYTTFFSSACVMQNVYSILQTMGNLILSMVSWLVWLCGTLFNLSIIKVVIQMKDLINNIGVIFTVWKTLRDFVNMFFIFILLVVAIQTILDSKYNYKIILRNVVLVALFINFSFFATGVLIDASNTIALMFYKGFSNSDCTGTAQLGVVNNADGCMSYKIVEKLKLSTLYVQPTDTGGINQSVSAFEVNNLSSLITFFITIIAGSILMVIVAGIFLASAILILYRFVELVMLLMLSPIAFAAIILPSTKKHWTTWWNKLSDQLIFAPVYMMFLWISMQIITSSGLSVALNTGNANFLTALHGNMTQMFGLVVNYFIIISLLGYSLVLAKQLGAAGTEQAGKAAKGLQSYVGRQTIGKASSRIANSQVMQRTVAAHPFAGRIIQKPFENGAKATFGGKKGGFEQAEKDSIKQKQETAKRMGPNPLMVQNAKDEKKDAAQNLAAERKSAEETVNKKYANEQILVNGKYVKREDVFSAQKIADSENDLAKQKDNLEKIIANETDPTKTPAQQASAQKARIDAEKEITEKQKALDLMKSQQESINKKMEDEIDAMVAPHSDRARIAGYQVDLLDGVDEKEATRRAKEAGPTKKQIDENVKEIMSKDSSLDINKATEQAKKIGLNKDQLNENISIIMKENPGLAKARREEFAKSNEANYGNAITNALGNNVLTRTASRIVNTVTNHKTALAESAAIRKDIKGKSKADEFYEAAKKEATDEVKAESSGADKPASSGGSAKPSAA